MNNTPLHTLVKAKFSDDNVKLDCIVALLAYGGCDPDSNTADGKTALHLAVEVCIHYNLPYLATVVNQKDVKFLQYV